ncbi:MAG: efflux RND transporter periplasmic adaptor subunit [Acidobacteriota bacterium]|nr:MAG: efflux RND transporter periplasmic adaptor subunit [Acidobacteriota bacterium]
MSKKKRSRKLVSFISLAVLSGAIAIVVAMLGSKPLSVDADSLAIVELDDLARSVVATGIIEPISNKIEIRSKASGLVKEVHVDVGDQVKPGQVLVELDRDQLLAQLRESEANLQAAKADFHASEAALERAEILAEEFDVQLAESNHQRSIELYEQRLIAQSQFDSTLGRLEEARNRQRAAVASIGVSKAAIAQKQAQVAQCQAIFDRIEEELSYTAIRSPIRGVVLARDVEVGSAVSSILTMGAGATTVLTLGDMNDVYVKGEVSESDIGLVEVGLPARITVESYRDKVFSGTVYKISPLGREEENVTSFEVRVSVENPEGLLLANMSANAEIILEEHKQVLTIPEGAILYDEEKHPYVEVPDANLEAGRRRVDIQTDISTGTKAEVVDGLNQGDQVILQ